MECHCSYLLICVSSQILLKRNKFIQSDDDRHYWIIIYSYYLLFSLKDYPFLKIREIHIHSTKCDFLIFSAINST